VGDISERLVAWSAQPQTLTALRFPGEIPRRLGVELKANYHGVPTHPPYWLKWLVL